MDKALINLEITGEFKFIKDKKFIEKLIISSQNLEKGTIGGYSGYIELISIEYDTPAGIHIFNFRLRLDK